MTEPLTLLVQNTAIRTPDTGGYMVAAYLVIGFVLTAYFLFLWSRGRRAEEE